MSHNQAHDPLGVLGAERLQQLVWIVGGVIVLAVSSRISPLPVGEGCAHGCASIRPSRAG